MYFDRAIPFGLRHGAMCCHRVTNSICHIMEEQHQADSLAYIDDFGAVTGPEVRAANTEYLQLKTLILDLQLTLAFDKCAAPSTVMSWIGTTFDSVNMVMYIDEDKVAESLAFCQQMSQQPLINLRTLESLLGRLIYSSKLALHARNFLNRTLHFRRSFTSPAPLPFPEGVKEDLHWFCNFLPKYNGFAVIRSLVIPSTEIFTDACLVGCGGFQPLHSYFYLSWGDLVSKWSVAINELECFNILIALRLWAKKLQGATVRVWCDNSATVASLHSGTTQNLFTAACLGEITFLTAVYDITILSTHIEGKANVTADLLSRAQLSEANHQKFLDFVHTTELSPTDIEGHILDYPDSNAAWYIPF